MDDEYSYLVDSLPLKVRGDNTDPNSQDFRRFSVIISIYTGLERKK
jgi:hypothetical protein